MTLRSMKLISFLLSITLVHSGYSQVAEETDNYNSVNDDVYYANYTEVRDVEASSIHKSDPGYSSKLNRDGDDVGCE